MTLSNITKSVFLTVPIRFTALIFALLCMSCGSDDSKHAFANSSDFSKNISADKNGISIFRGSRGFKEIVFDKRRMLSYIRSVGSSSEDAHFGRPLESCENDQFYCVDGLLFVSFPKYAVSSRSRWSHYAYSCEGNILRNSNLMRVSCRALDGSREVEFLINNNLMVTEFGMSSQDGVEVFKIVGSEGFDIRM